MVDQAPPRIRADSAPLPIPGWLPDAITLARVALLPVLLLVAEAMADAARSGLPTARLRAATLLLLLTIAASDKVDGYLARRSGCAPTRRGAFLDAGADRLVQWAGGWFFTVRAAPAFTPLPLWFPILIVGRDALLLLAWLRHPRRGGVPLEHEVHGKAATFAVFVLLLGAILRAPAIAVDLMAAAAGGLVVFSAIGYARRMRESRRKDVSGEDTQST